MRLLFIALCFVSTVFSGFSSIFTPEEVDSREKAVSAVHKIMQARVKYHEECLEYLKSQDTPIQEKLDLVSDYTGLIRSQTTPVSLCLHIRGINQDLDFFKRLATLSENPNKINILNFELFFVSKALIKEASNRLEIQLDAKANKRKSKPHQRAVLECRGQNPIANDAVWHNLSSQYIAPYVSETSRELRAFYLEATAQIDPVSGKVSLHPTASWPTNLHPEGEAREIINRISLRLRLLEPYLAAGLAGNLWKTTNRLYSESLDPLLERPMNVLGFMRKVEALYNQESIIDTLIKRHIPTQQPPLPPLMVTPPERARPQITPKETATPKAAAAAALSEEPISEPQKVVSLPPVAAAAAAEPLSEDTADLPSAADIDTAALRQWTPEEKAAAADSQPMLSSPLFSATFEESLSRTIQELMKKKQLNFYEDVVPKILNPLLKKDLDFGRRNENMHLFIPYRNDPNNKELIYFHAPHGHNVEAGCHIFWRHQLKSALRTTGWI